MPRALWKELCSYYYSSYENICAARAHARTHARTHTHTHSLSPSLPPLVEVRIVRGMTAQWEDSWHIDQTKSTRVS